MYLVSPIGILEVLRISYIQNLTVILITGIAYLDISYSDSGLELAQDWPIPHARNLDECRLDLSSGLSAWLGAKQSRLCAWLGAEQG